MKQLHAQLTLLTALLSQHCTTMLAMLCPLLILLNAFSLPLPEHIYQGQSFFYSWYLDAIARSRLLIIVGFLLFGVLILRIFVVKSNRSGFVLPAVFFFLTVLWLLSPAIGGVSHIATTPVYNETTYNLYFQSYSGPSTQSFVLVKCDSLGLLCSFAEKWEREVPFFDASNYGLRLDAFNKTLYVRIDGGGITKYPLE
jgi:hypothetical protein